MINCMIVDDEPLALDLLEDNIRRIPFLNLVARCKNAMEAIGQLQHAQIDLVITDIQMPTVNGLQFVAALQHKPMFIFHTAFEKYALPGYELDIVDYLLKPVSFDRFLQACNRALEQYNLKKIRDTRPSAARNEPQPEYVFLNVDYSLVKIVLSELKYIEAKKDYMKLYFINAEKKELLVRLSMKAIEDILPSNKFIRIHKSYIINASLVTAIRKSAVYIDSLEFVVSEPYRDAINRITNGKLLN
jgi:two-component system, LytTR family, response regulator